MEDVVKCSVNAPKCLYHPVLLLRCNKKLLFCLCRTCAEEEKRLTRECTHESVEKRAVLGTWAVDEVSEADAKGYVVVNVCEFYEYQVTEYNQETGEG
jgi:hypothetical protein